MFRLRILRVAPAGVLALILASLAWAGPPQAIHRYDFEADVPDSLPKGWFSRRSLREGYRIATSPEAAHGGRQGLVLEMAKDPPTWNSFGAAAVRIGAQPFRGRRVRLTGWGRFHQTAMNDGRGQFYVRVDRAERLIGDFDNMQDRPFTTPEWKQAHVLVGIAADADTLVLGALMSGHGRFDVDDVTVTLLGPVGEGDQPARPISDRGVTNLAAFGRLASVVRFFHPSDEAAALDWNAFIIDHVREVEDARTPAELAALLRVAFAPVAPTVRIDVKPPATVKRADLVRSVAPADARVGWFHHGFGGSATRSIYRSERLSRPLDAGVDVLPLGAAWAGTLGGGVHAQVPLVLAKAGGATLPRPKAIVATRRTERPEDWAASGGDRSTRLAAVLLASGVLEQFYPYADVVRLDMPAAVDEALRSAATATAASFTSTLARLSSHLHDGHGTVSGPGRPSKWLPLAFEFVGNDLAVISTSDSAGRARVGDVVIALDGRPVAEALDELRAELSASTEGHMRSRLGQRMMMTDVPRVLTLRAPDGRTREVRFEPGVGMLPPPPADPDSIAEVKPGIYYVDLERVTDADWKREVERFAKGKGLIFDMRGYPSRISAAPIAHLTREPVWSARWNVPVLRKPFMADVEWDTTGRWPVAPNSPHITAPVVFITDGRAVSYAETWMGMIEAYQLGTIVGEPTAGTNGNVSSIALPGGYSMSYTGMKVLKHDGSRHHGIGIHPTVPASRTIQGLAAGRDEALERAIEVVSKAR